MLMYNKGLFGFAKFSKRLFYLYFLTIIASGFITNIWAGWVFRSPMRFPRYGVMVAAVNNLIYAIGGFGIGDTGVRYVEEYNPVLDTWIPKAPMPTPRGGGVCAVINNKIYVIGGGRTRNMPVETCEVYDPKTNQWQRRRRLPTRRYGYAGSVIGESIYVVGGFLMPHGGRYTDTVEVYLPSRDSWFVRKSMITPRVELGCAQVNNKLYAIGGVLYGYTGANEQYYPDTWITKRQFPILRSRHTCAVLNNNIYVIGGRRQQGANEIIFSRVDVYNPILDTWTIAESLNIARYYAGATVLNGNLYVIGGYARNVGPIASVEQFVTTGYEETTSSSEITPHSLLKVFPNPLRTHTVIYYELKQPGKVLLSIYDAKGQLKRTLANQFQTSGSYSVNWDGTDQSGRQVPKGAYFVKLSLFLPQTRETEIDKILVLR